MRLPDERTRRLAHHCALALILVPALAGCASHETLASAPTVQAAANGPAADYPVVIGDPYRIGATLYTPADTMNYDEVGYAAADNGPGVSGSHHTLPLPSYVEVTSLATGRTILVRLERRGPMTGNALIALSPAAFAQLGASAGDPVRVRRVNPPEEERAALRSGKTAPARMNTPASLVAVLRRKLPGEGSVALLPRPSPTLPAVAAVTVPPSAAQQPQVQQVPGTSAAPLPLSPLATRASPPKAAPTAATPVLARAEKPAPAATRPKAPAEATGAYIVQAATMSTAERAEKVAGTIGGSVKPTGRYFRVRTGPFATREQAEASLAKVRAAGYSDARISTQG